MELVELIEQLVVLLSALCLVFLYGELSMHNFQLRQEALKEDDEVTARFLRNQALLSAGVAGAGIWLLLVVFVNDDGMWTRAVYVVALLLGCLCAIWLYRELRFRS